jgi:hypothetical protein
MKDPSERHGTRGRKRSDTPQSLQTEPSDQDYRVGPGRPPKQHQFKPGQSGNPAGARRKPKSIALDLKELLERTLKEEVTLRQGEREKIITKAAAGIQHLVNQFAKGDRHARRDLFALAETLGVDLVAGGAGLEQTVAAALSANDEALLADYVRRHATLHTDEIDAGDPPEETAQDSSNANSDSDLIEEPIDETDS